jgi:hypothetical protein
MDKPPEPRLRSGKFSLHELSLSQWKKRTGDFVLLPTPVGVSLCAGDELAARVRSI